MTPKAVKLIHGIARLAMTYTLDSYDQLIYEVFVKTDDFSTKDNKKETDFHAGFFFYLQTLSTYTDPCLM